MTVHQTRVQMELVQTRARIHTNARVMLAGQVIAIDFFGEIVSKIIAIEYG